MSDISLIKDQLKKLLKAQRFAVLSTHSDQQPYASLVAFAATNDLRELVFVTGSDSRKYKNLIADSRAAMMIDNRTNKKSDIQNAVAATACGFANVIDKTSSQDLIKLYLAKHPDLEQFMISSNSVVISLSIKKYYFVAQFQNVYELSMD